MRPAFDLSVGQNESGTPVVRVTGEVDLLTSPRLSCALTDLVRKGYRHVIVDLSQVSFLDSTGLHALLSGRVLLQEQDGLLTLVAPAPVVQRVLNVTGTWRMFSICKGKQEAARPFEQPEPLRESRPVHTFNLAGGPFPSGALTPEGQLTGESGR